VTFDATATSTSPTHTALGTFLGDTLSAACVSDGAGGAETVLYISTSDGSWNADYTDIDRASASSTFVSSVNVPAGTLSSPLPVQVAFAASGGNEEDQQFDFIQLGPGVGSMIWHGMATTFTTNPTCHLSVQTFPETITAVAGTPHASARPTSHLPLRLGRH